MEEKKDGRKVLELFKPAKVSLKPGEVYKVSEPVKIGKFPLDLKKIRKIDRTNSMQKVFELNYKGNGEYGTSPLMSVIRDLIYLDLLEKANVEMFLNKYDQAMTPDERRYYVDKYGVQIDPKKVEKQKKKTPGEKTAGINDPNVNIPLDPDLGSEPFEKDPEDG